MVLLCRGPGAEDVWLLPIDSRVDLLAVGSVLVLIRNGLHESTIQGIALELIVFPVLFAIVSIDPNR